MSIARTWKDNLVEHEILHHIIFSSKFCRCFSVTFFNLQSKWQTLNLDDSEYRNICSIAGNLLKVLFIFCFSRMEIYMIVNNYLKSQTLPGWVQVCVISYLFCLRNMNISIHILRPFFSQLWEFFFYFALLFLS